VINVESSHCYGNMAQFVKEVSRVLKPGGYFSWVDLRSKEMLAEMESAFNLAELNLIHNETITKEVIQALDDIHERKMTMIADNVPKAIQTAFRDFAGVKDSQIYNAFQEGKAVYLAKTFQKVVL
jgi:ubiquinone/menaquinone biosynthesis C-methylase UbiE